MKREIAYIGLGSNFPDKDERLARAVDELGALPDFEIAGVSSAYLTEPQGIREQPWFANRIVAAIPGPSWSPATLLKRMLEIEAGLGRTRGSTPRNGPRAIDLDLLLYGERKLSLPECVVPHPRLLRRAFVLAPLIELAPDIVIDGVLGGDALSSLDWRLEGNRIYQGAPDEAD